MVPEEVLRGHRHVRLELADPDAVGPLQLEQPLRAAVDRRVQISESSIVLGHGHAESLADQALKMC